MGNRFVFVNLSIRSGYNSGINHGLAYLVPIVKKYGYEPHVINMRSEMSVDDFASKVDSLNPSIVGFSCVSNQLVNLTKYSRAIKGKKLLQLAGGVAATLEPEELLSSTSVDGACVGEGEIPLNNLLENIKHGRDIFGTDGFCWRRGEGVRKSPAVQFITDLSELEFPDYSIFEDYIVSNRGNLLITLSRGCPYNCTYCCNEAIRKVYPSPKKYFRVPSVEHSIALLVRMVARYPGTRYIQFEDDLLISDKEWFGNFSQEYKKRIDLPYSCCVRGEYINTDIAKYLKSSNCVKVLIGLESGNERLRNELLSRRYSNALFLEKAKIIKDQGIELYTFNMVGFPTETEEALRDTLKLNMMAQADNGICTFFYPYRGTELYRLCQRDGLLKEEASQITNYNTRPAIRLIGMSEKACIRYQRKITNYLVSQAVKYNYKKYAMKNPGFMKYPHYLYLWFALWAKPNLVRIVFSSTILFSVFSKVKRHIYGKKAQLERV